MPVQCPHSAVGSILTGEEEAMIAIGLHLTEGALKAIWAHASEATVKSLQLKIGVDFYHYNYRH